MMSLLLLAGVVVAGGPPGADALGSPPDVAPPPRVADGLPSGAVARMGSRLFRHPGGVQTLQFGLGGKVLVSTGNGSAVVWDVATGRPVRTLGTPDGEEQQAAGQTLVRSVGVRADGKSFFAYAHQTVGNRGFVTRPFVWDLEKDAEAGRVRFAQDKARKSYGGPGVFAPDGSALAELGHDGTIWLWDGSGTPAGRLTEAIDNHGSWAWREPAAFGPDGQTLVVGRVGGAVDVWDVTEQKRVRSLEAGKGPTHALAVSADGKHLATFGGRPTPKGEPFPRVPAAVRVWEPDTGRAVVELPWEAAGPDNSQKLNVGFLPDGSVWATAAGDGTITYRQWDRETGRAVRDWTAPVASRDADAVAVSPDGGRVAVETRGGVIALLAADTGQDLTPGVGHRAEVTDLRFTADGKRLVTAADDGTVRTWDAVAGTQLGLIGKVGPFPHLSADGGVVYAGEAGPKAGRKESWTLTARATDTGNELWRTPGLFGAVPSPDGKTAWAIDYGNPAATVIDTATGKAIRPAAVPGIPLAFAADGGRAVYFDGKTHEVTVRDAATGDKKHGWNAEDAKLLRAGRFPGVEQDFNDGVDAAAVSPDGKRLALVVTRNSVIEKGEHAALYLCEAAGGAIVWEVRTQAQLGRSVEFGPDGQTVAVAGPTAKVYDAATGKEVATFDGHRGPVGVVRFSPDGTRLATGGTDGTAVVWRVPGR